MSGSDLFGFEDELRRARPEPEFEFMRALEARVLAPAPARRRGAGLRVAAAVVASAALAAALGATGGLSYAASSLAGAVQRATAPERAIAVRGLGADGDQYRPGYGFGDPNHNHSGPPGLQAKGDSTFAPPAQPKTVDGGRAVVATTQVTLDEQAVLYVQVVDAKGRPVLLTQQGSRVGGAAGSGPQTKTLVYKVLVPRTIPLALRVPGSAVEKGAAYRIRIVAVDPQGNRSTLLVPFRV